jgi:hypothetical protein
LQLNINTGVNGHNSNPAKIKTGRSHIILFSVIFIGIVLFIYVFIKSYTTSFTHDESFSYLHYSNESFIEIISCSHCYTNNHLLNSLFMKYSEKLFGSSEIALRLPNLLLLIVYMIYSYLLFKNTNSFLTVAMFTLMCTNCVLIDLFGLARGYGMSCGFMLMSLYHFIRYFKYRKITDLSLFHTAALLACLSNFTLLIYYAAILVVYNIIEFLNNRFITDTKYRIFNSNKIHIIPLIIVIIELYEPVRKVIKHNILNFGGKTGFYPDTVKQLIYSTFHGIRISSLAVSAFQIIFTCLILFSLSIIVFMIIKKNKSFFEQYSGLIISCFLVILMSVIIILSHLITGADYPTGRFSIFLFPVFMVHFGFLVHYLMSLKYREVTLAFISVIALLSMINFWQKTDRYSYGEWAYDMDTKDMIQTLMTHRENRNPGAGNIKLGINWIFEPAINYYRVSRGIDWLLPVDRDGISKNDDYYYIFKYELTQLDSSKYEIIKEYKNINTLLIMNIKATDKE